MIAAFRLSSRLIAAVALTGAVLVAGLTGEARAQGSTASPTRSPVQTPIPFEAAAPDVPTAIARTERIEAELVPLTEWAAPGGTALVAVRQRIQPGWHTYWRNPGDSGGPTTLDWILPAGVRAGDILWPTPERLRLMTLMNYGYSGEVYLPVPVEIPADARPGRDLPLRVAATFLVCSAEMCVPDTLNLGLTLRVAEGAPPETARHGAAIRRVVETAPRPAGITARLTSNPDGGLILSATGGPLAGLDLHSAYFYPDQPGRIDHAAIQTGEAGAQDRDGGLTLRLTPGRNARPGEPLSGVLWTDRGAWEITAEPGPVLAGAAGGRALTSGEAEDSGAASGLIGLMRIAGLALLGGLILNLMPCVFPVLAMKAASLTAAAHDPRRARRDGFGFLIGVMIAFLALAGVLLALRAAGQAVGWGFQLQSPAVTAGLALLMLAVALNLSGVYHAGADVQTASGAVGGRANGPLSRLPEGFGAILTGVLAVAVAAPCTAPFMAAALGAALTMNWPQALTVFACLGLGLALPYLAISLSPGLMARLPRPGPWMERLRNLLALPMYGAALWLAWVFARQSGHWGLSALIVAAVALILAAWLFGRTQAVRFSRTSGKQGRWLGVASAAALIVCGLGWTAAARAPVAPEASGEGAEAGVWTPAAVQVARAEGRPVLVNFTADWCVSCKINETTALSSSRVAQALKDTNAVYLKADWTRRDATIARELDRLGRSGVPLYLLYPADGGEPRILPQLLTPGLVAEALEDAKL